MISNSPAIMQARVLPPVAATGAGAAASLDAASSAGATSAWAGPPALAGVVSCAQPAAARARIIAAASFPLCSIGATPLWKAGNPAITGHGRQGFADEPHGGRPDASGAR